MVPLYFGLTPNQVVSYNLAQARQLRRWTQQQAIDALEPHLGARWSIANYSAAERSVDGGRIRNFDADEIVAFARTFDLPITWFFMPPPPWASPGVPATLQTPDAERFGAPLALLADLVFGTDEHAALLALRLEAFRPGPSSCLPHDDGRSGPRSRRADLGNGRLRGRGAAPDVRSTPRPRRVDPHRGAARCIRRSRQGRASAAP